MLCYLQLDFAVRDGRLWKLLQHSLRFLYGLLAGAFERRGNAVSEQGLSFSQLRIGVGMCAAMQAGTAEGEGSKVWVVYFLRWPFNT